jgi:phosphatidyl-myo-inositol alpha-mannosyltransferase
VRIAFTHAYCWPEVRRGAERFIPSLGAALARRGHEVVHFTAADAGGRDVLDGVEIVRLRRLRERGYRHEADFGRRVLPHLAARRFDAVHSMGRRDALASVRAARLHSRRRTVYTDLGIPMRDVWRNIPKEARAVEKVVAGIDVYSCMSRWAVDHLRREYAREDGAVVPGGIDFERFVPAPAREPHPVILFSGAFDAPHKEVPLLLEALALVAEHEPEAELWLSGEGDPEPLLEAAPPAARERTRNLGVGDAHRQHERYGRAWVTCLPSRFDSFGMALLESLACGTPLVTTTEGAPHELVTEHVTGELCAPGDARGLAAACVRAFELARRPGTVDACRSTAEPFDWDRGLAPLVERLYAGEKAGEAPLVERLYAGEEVGVGPQVGQLYADDGLGA